MIITVGLPDFDFATSNAADVRVRWDNPILQTEWNAFSDWMCSGACPGTFDLIKLHFRLMVPTDQWETILRLKYPHLKITALPE